VTQGTQRQRSPVGQVLQTWRRHRRVSQLDLSATTGVTSRHISFVETGRSRPSRDMLDTLASALDMPLRDRNDLYLAAGYAPEYRELGLDAPELASVAVAIEQILASHEPRPAVVLDRHWNLVRSNGGAQQLFGSMLDLGALASPVNVLELIFDPNGLRPFIDNWDVLAPELLARARRESVGGVPDPELAELLDRLEREMPTAVLSPAAGGPLIDVAFLVDGTVRRYFSTVTTLGTPRDITLQELRIELFHPNGTT
jgi:transcriptional regulator with XRE-family HTH domain